MDGTRCPRLPAMAHQGSLRGGYRSNHCVTMRAVGEDASNVLGITLQHMEQKTKEELKPFAVVEVEVSTAAKMQR